MKKVLTILKDNYHAEQTSTLVNTKICLYLQPIPSRRLTEIFTFREPLNITCPEKYLWQFLKGNTCNNLTKLHA